MVQVRLKIEGGKELAKALEELPEKMQRKILRPAMFQAAAVVLSEARIQAPRKTGLLSSTLTAKVSLSRKGELKGTVRTKAGDYQGKTFYGSFQEYGWRAGSRKKYGISHKKGARSSTDLRPKVDANPFMRRAFDRTANQSVQIFTDMVREGVTKTLTKRGSK